MHYEKVAATTHCIIFCTRLCILKLLSFSYLAEQPVLRVKDPVHLPNHLPHHNASRVKTIIIRNKDPVLIRSEKEWKVWFPHLKYILIMNKLDVWFFIYFFWLFINFGQLDKFYLNTNTPYLHKAFYSSCHMPISTKSVFISCNSLHK